MLVNFLWRICLSGVKIHILTNFQYSSINIVVNKFFDLLDFLILPIGTGVTWAHQNLYGEITLPIIWGKHLIRWSTFF